MPIANELLNEIETELFAETGSSEMESSKVCETCGNQPCTCHNSDKTCPTCGKSPCQCKETKSNNSTQDTTMPQPLFDDPELNQLFDEHAPGEGAESGKEAKDPNPDTVGNQAEAELAKRKKCKTLEEELFEEPATEPDQVPGESEEEIEKRKKGGKKHKSDIADLFSDDLFKEKGEGDGDGTDGAPAASGEDDDEDDDDEIAEESALLITEAESALDFDL